MRSTELSAGGAVGVAIPAAGSGTRMGGVAKPFLELGGEPLLLRALRPFLAHPRVNAVAVALSEEYVSSPPVWLEELDRRVRLVRGGDTRAESVLAALRVLPATIDVVAVHDAARPLVTREVLDRCLAAVRPGCGAVAGWPVADTLKQVDEEGRVVATPSRERLWYAQTPQVFPRDLLLEAYERWAEDRWPATDDASVVERSGGEVVMVAGSPFNLKVTRREDLAAAESLIQILSDELY